MPASSQNALPFPNPTALKVALEWHKTVRLAVSGDVRLTKAEVEIIDTPDFQRLRRIQQLGPASWVYPTALHTRFDHSLGVLAVADDMVLAIREGKLHARSDDRAVSTPSFWISDEQRILARLYGLLHDITHVPFGHTLEDELKIFDSHDAFQADASPEHEPVASTGLRTNTDIAREAGMNPDASTGGGIDRALQLLGEDSNIGRIIIRSLGESIYNRFCNIYRWGKSRRLEVNDSEGASADEFVYYLVSDTVCADLIDYLQRDSFFCGLEVRIPTRFLNYLYVTDVEIPELGNRRRIVVRLWKPKNGETRHDVMTDLSGLLESRYLLSERVLFHHAKIIAGTMIGRAVFEATLAGKITSDRMLEHGDESLLVYLASLSSVNDSVACQISSRLAKLARERSLFDIVHQYTRREFHGDAGEDPDSDLIDAVHLAAERRLVENEIADIAGIPLGDVLIYVGSRKMNRKVAEAIVDYKGSLKKVVDIGTEELLKQRVDAIGAAHDKLWRAYILVSPAITIEQKELVQLAFEMRFFGKGTAVGKASQLLGALAAHEAGFANIHHGDLNKACGLAAKDLVSGRKRAAHGRSSRDALLDAVRSKLPN